MKRRAKDMLALIVLAVVISASAGTSLYYSVKILNPPQTYHWE